jgi:hypothetical protein
MERIIMGSSFGGQWFGDLLFIVAWFVVWLIPAAKISGKAGYSRWWCLVVVIPAVNVVFYWIFAFSSWPNLRGSSGSTPQPRLARQ